MLLVPCTERAPTTFSCSASSPLADDEVLLFDEVVLSFDEVVLLITKSDGEADWRDVGSDRRVRDAAGD